MTSEAKLQSDVMAPLNNGWAELREKGISKLEDFLTNGKAIDFSRKEYMQLYTTVYNLSSTLQNCTKGIPTRSQPTLMTEWSLF
jgi:hypothetical protein